VNKHQKSASERPPGAVQSDSHAAFAARLKELIEKVGSARAFAAQAGVSEGAVGTWLSRVEPTREKLAAIAKATGVSLDWLVTGRAACPPGYIAMRFADLRNSKGIATRPFFSVEQFIFLPLSLLDIAESERESIDPMALLLPPENLGSDAADFVVFHLTQEDESPPALGSLCAILDEGKVKIRAARSSAGVTDMSGPILGPVIFRGSIVRSSVVQKAKKRGTKPQ